MSVSIELVKKIREATGAGLNDVKEALDEAQG
ncbi:TPA: elongation factor Ts, partial [Candidatus Komeilibacteria bacterium]|nr:elongation factor Ts [Candidatus Komeilibacteria bacterium]